MFFYKKKILQKYHFKSQLILVFTLGIIVFSVSTTLLVSQFSNMNMRERILGEGLILTQSLAEQSTLALLYESKETASESVSIFMSFPDTDDVVIIDTNLNNVYSSSGKSNNVLLVDDKPMTAKLYLEDEKSWVFVSPVYVDAGEGSGEMFFPEDQSIGKQLVGFVELTQTKDTLKKLTTKILLYNFLLCSVLAAILLSVLLFFTHRLIRPVQGLAETMRHSERGGTSLRAKLDGPKDIVEMQVAFNSMMDELETRTANLKQARDAARESVKIKSEFVANVSHELRTPMNGILGMLEILSDYDVSSDQKNYIDMARNSARSLLYLIDDVLDFSKGEAGAIEVERREFSLGQEIGEIISLVGSSVDVNELELIYSLEPNVPDKVIGDSHRLRQVLVNLLSNAIKFTPSGSVFLRIDSLDSHKDDMLLQFSVIDTGIGIKKEKQKKIFSAFTQADTSTTRTFGGTGLGLSICRQIVDAMSGSIEVESEYGHGSTFRLNIPFGCGHNKNDMSNFFVDEHALLVSDNSFLYRSIRGFCQVIGLSCELTGMGKLVDHYYSLDEEMKKKYFFIFDSKILEDQSEDFYSAFFSQSSIVSNRVLLLGNPPKDNDFFSRLNWNGVFVPKPIIFSSFREKIKSLVEYTTASVPPVLISGPNKSNINDVVLDEFDFRHAKVLLVEDNDVNQVVVRGLLKPLGCDLDVASNGVEGLEFIEKNNYDIVFMDCSMPEMDGYEATRAIRKNESDKKTPLVVIAITANVSDRDYEKCVASGMNDYLPKPFSRSDLLNMFCKWIPSVKVKKDALKRKSNMEDSALPKVFDHVNDDAAFVDLKVFSELSDMLGDRMVELVKFFEDNTTMQIRALYEALRERNNEQIYQSAHSIKGSAANLGAFSLSALAEQLELAAKNDDAEISSLASKLQADSSKVTAHLKHLLGQS